jgi:hypothetical protein
MGRNLHTWTEGGKIAAIFCFESRKLDLQLLPSKIQ